MICRKCAGRRLLERQLAAGEFGGAEAGGLPKDPAEVLRVGKLQAGGNILDWQALRQPAFGFMYAACPHKSHRRHAQRLLKEAGQTPLAVLRHAPGGGGQGKFLVQVRENIIHRARHRFRQGLAPTGGQARRRVLAFAIGLRDNCIGKCCIRAKFTPSSINWALAAHRA